MAETGAIAAGEWFIGTDLTLRFTAYTDATKTTCVDVATYALQYVLRKGNSDADPALITKTTAGGTITVTGVFDATPATNLQRILVSILDTDTDSLRPGEYQHALKRTDAGNETILMYTDDDTPAVLTKAAA